MKFGPAVISIGVVVLVTTTLWQPSATSATSPLPDEAEVDAFDLLDARILSLSPDGQLLTASTPSSGRPRQLCVYVVATQAEQSCGDLDAHDISLAEDNVFWAPDSTKLAFTEPIFQSLVDGDLWVMDVSDGELTNLTDDGFAGRLPVMSDDSDPPDRPIHADVLPAWAPDSRSIAISRSSIVDGRFTGNDLVRVDVSSDEVEVLTTVSTEVPGVVFAGLAWAPDGERLYFSAWYSDPDDPNNGVWEFDRSSGESRQIIDSDPELGPPALVRVAADGATGLATYRAALVSTPTTNAFVLVDLDTYELSAIHPSTDAADVPVVVAAATFSPDGRDILYGLRDLGTGGGFFVRDIPAGKPRRLAVGAGVEPFVAMGGGGVYWVDDNTVFLAIDLGAGVVLDVDPAGSGVN